MVEVALVMAPSARVVLLVSEERRAKDWVRFAVGSWSAGGAREVFARGAAVFKV